MQVMAIPVARFSSSEKRVILTAAMFRWALLTGKKPPNFRIISYTGQRSLSTLVGFTEESQAVEITDFQNCLRIRRFRPSFQGEQDDFILIPTTVVANLNKISRFVKCNLFSFLVHHVAHQGKL